MFRSVKSFLNDHWKLLTALALGFGFVGWFLWGWVAWSAYTTETFGKWVTQLDFNAYGEGPFELFVMIPFVVLFIGAAIYTFFQKLNAS